MIRFQQTGKALGSEVTLTLIVGDEQTADKFFEELWKQINDFEDRFSRFKTKSELTKFNNTAGEDTKISPEFRELLDATSNYMHLTGGLFSPFVLPALQRAGYKGSWPDPDSFDKTLDYRGLDSKINEKIIVNDNSAKIPYGTALDFGGIGKGFLLEQLADFLTAHEIDNFWLSLGGDIVCQGNDINNNPWEIGIAEVEGTGLTVTAVQNRAGARLAVATSGTTKRKGEDWHHIIDPRIGHSAKTDILMATVVTHNGIEADIFAKCLVILGSKNSKAFIKKHEIHQAILQIWDNGEVLIKQGGSVS